MRFLKPNPGECADRQTILQLKLEHGQAIGDQKVSQRVVEVPADEPNVVRGEVTTKMENPAPVNIEPFLQEHEMIQKYLEENYFPNIAAYPDKQKKFDEYFTQLEQVNRDLWKLEDTSRILRDAPDSKSALVLQRKGEVLDLISSLNDQRAMMVRQINSLWNIYTVEKLHK